MRGFRLLLGFRDEPGCSIWIMDLDHGHRPSCVSSLFTGVHLTFLWKRMGRTCAWESTTTRAASASWPSCTTRHELPQLWQPRTAPCGPWWVQGDEDDDGEDDGRSSRLVVASSSRIAPRFTGWLSKTTQRRGECTRPSSSPSLFSSLSRFSLHKRQSPRGVTDLLSDRTALFHKLSERMKIVDALAARVFKDGERIITQVYSTPHRLF